MNRDALEELIGRLSLRQTAPVEQRRYKQRGGQRQPGAQGGVFLQKITDADRVLADLFQVSSPRTIGNAFLDVRPILEEDGYLPTPGPFCFRPRPTRLPHTRTQHAQRNTKLVPYRFTSCETLWCDRKGSGERWRRPCTPSSRRRPLRQSAPS